ncbi:MAG TPA: cation diffusion facilitator family transporter, partial [Gemmatimonadaceae bacterium]|nr:cation diffusion facilitator family transporter [Gemmatimonadaceae bacterium]
AAGANANAWRLSGVLALTATYMVGEAVGGYLTHSLALLADAGHMLSDVGALGLSLFAAWISRRPATVAHSYGYYRTEILAATANAATLIAVSIAIAIEAFHRLAAPTSVDGRAVMAIAFGGFLMNLVGMWVLRAGQSENLNVRGAWLHVATDAVGNIGTVIAGFLVAFVGWVWADPVASMLICVLVLWSSWGLLSESVSVLMEGTPSNVDPDAVRDALRAVGGVREVHDLHIWSITSGLPALSAHVFVDETRSDRDVLPELCAMLRHRFSIEHVTLQLERECASDIVHA